jgi:hypothetical protein
MLYLSADPPTMPLFNLNAKKQPLPGFIQKGHEQWHAGGSCFPTASSGK